MTQQTETKPRFQFIVGTGVLRSKPTPTDTVIMAGGITLPNIGACYIDGLREKQDTEMVLNIKDAKERKLVATITLPTGPMEKREGKIKLEGKRKVYKVVAELRRRDDSIHMALRLPEVKIAGSGFF